MTFDEELAFYTVIEKEAKARLDELKSQAKYRLMELNETEGVDRVALNVNGNKCGSVSVVYSKEHIAIKPGFENVALSVLHSMNLTEEKPIKNWEEQFVLVGENVVSKDTGEVYECFMKVPETAKTVTVRIQSEKAISNLRPLIDANTINNLLEA